MDTQSWAMTEHTTFGVIAGVLVVLSESVRII